MRSRSPPYYFRVGAGSKAKPRSGSKKGADGAAPAPKGGLDALSEAIESGAGLPAVVRAAAGALGANIALIDRSSAVLAVAAGSGAEEEKLLGLDAGVETVELTLIGRDTYDVVSDSVFASVTIEDGGSALGVEGEAPGTFYLSAPYPNPFAVRTAFKLGVSETQPIRVDVYNVIGKRVASVFDGTVQAGIDYEFLVDGEGLPNGLYMIKVSGRDASVRSVVLQR